MGEHVVTSFQGIQWTIADCYGELYGASLARDRAAMLAERGEEHALETTLAKKLAIDASEHAVNEAFALVGGYGLYTETDFGQLLHDMKVLARRRWVVGGPPQLRRPAGPRRGALRGSGLMPETNLTGLILDRAERRPDARFGVADAPVTLADAVARARRTAAALGAADVAPGTRVAVVGETSTSYLLTWMALVFAGAEPALINPAYPADLLEEMMADLEPAAVVWLHREPDATVAESVPHLDASDVAADRLVVVGSGPVDGSDEGDLPGLARRPLDVAGYMHTSGTTGVPKFCIQTHEYFLRLGRFIADSMCLSPVDTVFAPLPMFHINPLGYGVIGGLTGGAEVLGTRRFSASGFWPLVRSSASRRCSCTRHRSRS